MPPAARPTLFLLVRHGVTATTGHVLPGRAPGLHLSEAGAQQAAAVAERLATLKPRPAAVYASPLERTRETAAPIGRALGHRVTIDRGLLECDFGEWTGRKLAALRRRAEWRQVQTSPSTFRFPGGESFGELQLRAWTTLERLAADHRGRRVVIVSHADWIKAAATYALGVPLDLFQRTVVSPCSITAIVAGAGSPIVLCLNSLGALSELVPS